MPGPFAGASGMAADVGIPSEKAGRRSGSPDAPPAEALPALCVVDVLVVDAIDGERVCFAEPEGTDIAASFSVTAATGGCCLGGWFCCCC